MSQQHAKYQVNETVGSFFVEYPTTTGWVTYSFYDNEQEAKEICRKLNSGELSED